MKKQYGAVSSWRMLRAKLLLFLLILDIFAVPCSYLFAHAPYNALTDQDLHTILTSSEPLIYLGPESTRKDGSAVVTLPALKAAVEDYAYVLKQKIIPTSVTITHDQMGRSTTCNLYQCDDVRIAPSASYAGFTFTFNGPDQSFDADNHIAAFFDVGLRSFNNSSIKVNADGNVDMRMTGTTTLLGLVTLPGTAQKSVTGSLVYIDPTTGNIGVGNSNYTFTSDVFVIQGSTLWVSKVDPRSPTTTVTYSGSISLPSPTTANNGSLQINGIPFLHNFGTNDTFAGANAGNLTMSGANNTAVGTTALHANTTGGANTAVGVVSMAVNTTGGGNSAFGVNSLAGNTTGSLNTALGASALFANTTGGQNTSIGHSSLSANTVGGENTACGYLSLRNNTASQNTAVGHSSLRLNTTGAQNVAFGHLALERNVTGSSNTAVGQGALSVNTASNNTAVGQKSLFNNTSGSSNTAVGQGSLQANTTGASNVAVGGSSLAANTIGQSNTALGFQSMQVNITGTQNTAVGMDSLQFNTNGINNVAVGTFSLQKNVNGSSNTAVGAGSLINNTIGNSNTALGFQSMQSNITGTNNTAVGQSSLYANTNGINNTAVGLNSLLNNTSGVSNTAIGVSSLTNNTTGGSNTAIGASSLQSNTTGANNTALGLDGLEFNTTGNNGTAVGLNSLQKNTTGSNNTAIGVNSLQNNTTGANNTTCGYYGLNAFRIGTTGRHAAFGANTLSNLVTGTANTAIGSISTGVDAGSSLIIGSDNIYLANRGVAQESTTIRIGTTTTHTGCLIAGISGVTIPNNVTVLINTTGKLGTVASSRRYKDDIQDMADASAGLLKLRPVTFTYKTDETKTCEYGLIAEEVEEVYPELVAYKDGLPETVRYHIFPSLLLNEYQKLYKLVQDQAQQLDEMSKRLTMLEDHVHKNGINFRL